jgi:hypothetical protein
MRRASIVIGFCMVAALALTLMAQAPADLDPVMKQVQPTMQSLNKNIEGKMAKEAAADAEKLQALFKDVANFFKTKKLDKGATLASDAMTAAGKTASDAKANKLDEAKASAGGIQKTCKACHDIHREQLPDKSYKFKEK